MSEIAKYLSVYLAGATGIWKGIPLGIAFHLPPWLNASLVALGATSAVLLLYFAGTNFRNWLFKKFGSKSMEHKKERFKRWMDRYGIMGLGLMVTGLLGHLIALLLGMILVKNTRKFLIYLIAGIVIWSFALSFLFNPIGEMLKTALK
jgi:membrane protein DedA with SNARE-associated domain